MITQVERTDDRVEVGVETGPQLPRIALALALVAGALGLWGGRSADAASVDGYGLISALPAVYWLAVGLATVTTALLFWVAADPENGRYANAAPMLWLVLLHTAPQLAHEHVRFPTVWAHLGFIRTVEETGSGDLLTDARFAWPGFFGAFVAPLARLDPALLEPLLRLWPTFITGGTAILVAALARRSYPQVANIGSVSSLVYVLMAWTGQDYFSPQSVGFLWYIAILVVLESGYLYTSTALSSQVPLISRFSAAGGDRPAARSTPAFVALLILSYGAIVSHPLAPFFICMALVVLGLYGRKVAWRLLLFVGVSYGLWFVISARPWWSTGLDGVLNEVGDFVGNLEPGSTVRVDTPSADRANVTSVRDSVARATFGSVLIIGLLMVTERFKHLRPAVPLVPLAAVPAVALALQSQRGEITVRVLLYTLPMASILAGRLVAMLRRPALTVVAAGMVATLAPVLLIARFGNESFEYSTGADRAAMEAAYARADDDTLFVADNGHLPWRDRTIGRNVFAERWVETSDAWIAGVEQLASDQGLSRIIVVLTRSQNGWRVHGMSDEADFLAQFARWLSQRPGSEVLYQQDGAWAIEL